MPTATGHTSAITASKVSGTSVYDTKGDKIGHVEDLVLDKMSNSIMFAIVSFGGFLGIGEKYHSVPWSVLDYNKEMGGYSVPMSKEMLEKAPIYSLGDFIKDDGGMAIRDKSFDYYSAAKYW